MMAMVVCPYQEAGCAFYVSSVLFVSLEGPGITVLNRN